MQSCCGCDLYLHATRAVVEEGPAKVMGPAGRPLDRVLNVAGIDRTGVFVTNAVKHFKFEERGKRRIRKKPSTGEVRACKPWLDAEIALAKPKVIGCLGATAAKALLGSEFRISVERGQVLNQPAGDLTAPRLIATVHPSSILRAPDAARRELEFGRFVEDLKVIARLLRQ